MTCTAVQVTPNHVLSGTSDDGTRHHQLLPNSPRVYGTRTPNWGYLNTTQEYGKWAPSYRSHITLL